MSPILGFSLNGLTNDVGVYAGLAAVLGVAVLALLFFAQARELRRLREWTDAAPERAQELEERLMARARREPPAGAAPAVAAPAVTAPVAPAPSAVTRPAPAGVGAPALASATRFRGVVATPRASSSPAVPAAATAAAAARVASGSQASNGTNGGGAPPAARTAIPARTGPATGTRPPVAAAAADGRSGRSPRRRVALLAALTLLVLAVVAGVVFAATQLGSGGKSSPAPPGAGAPAGRPAAAGGRGFSRGSVVVTVLNGTPVPHLANQVASRLRADGFQRGTVTNASDQQRSATTISYVAGHRRDALAVSRALGISDVGAIDPATRSIACPQPACSTTVVVTVGSDRIR